MPQRAQVSPERPAGLVYRPDFLGAREEQQLVALLEGLDFRPVVLHGHAARRTVRHYGLDDGYESGELVPADPLPAGLTELRDLCAALMERDPDDLVQVLVSRYPPGAGIGWHRDAPIFGSKIAGVSLLAACRMRFQRSVRGVRSMAELELAPCSAYLLAGAARWSWQHSIPATRALRYSITFRTLRRA